MAISGDIEKLERRWIENPTGLMFAPLAEAYRKAGDTARALEILEQGLGQHPDYVPALIVRGRCQLDGEAHPEAEAAFQQALDRDPVNPIALKGLAEVFERTGRHGLAIERLEVLLEVDRGDTDARADLARLRELPSTAPVSPLVPAPAVAFLAPEGEPAVDPLSIVEEPELRWGQAPVAATPAAPWAEWMPGGIKAESEEAESEPVEVESLVGFVTNDSDGPMMHLLAAAETVEPEAQAEDEAAAPEPIAEAPQFEPAESKGSSWASWRDAKSEPAPADAEDAEGDAEAGAEVDVEVEAEAEALAVAEPVAEEEADEPIAIEELVMAEELIVTESMAELFLRQGHRELALAVYRQLVANPEYGHLHGTIAVLERASGMSRDAAPPVPASLPDAVPAIPAAEPARRGAAADTGGVPVATFLREVLDAPPPAADAAVLPPAIERAPAGEPTRDAGHPLSLSDVFGEESAPAAHPAIPAEERRVAPVPEAPAPTEPSYDEFFGAIGSEEEMPGAAVGSESEHLEQFNEWLRGLKR